ncbi:hypothetical protein [Methylorubrum extorquens]|uniref:Glycine-rich domain-containing protein n=1 Tax=Methylorubrum extorquens DSM 13060 TaxID=882800 RepID=H1KC50_METEX|nr:hypothetical protein [Methylorubrum extorquens]EHP94867.1 hypothetical protein MetexDRAFT_0212 [Methylorubrum extorquens DSM 13060]
MKQDFPALWAESPATLRREPTNGEMANGFPCGPLDLPLWNELMYRQAQAYREIATAIIQSGQTPNQSNTGQLWAAIQSVAAPPPALWHRGTDTSTNPLAVTASVAPSVSSYAPLVPYNVLVNNDSADGGTTANFGPGIRQVVRADGSAIRKGDWTKGQVAVFLDDGARLQLTGAAPAGVVQTQITTTFNTLAITGGRTSVFSTPGSFTWTAPEGASRARVIAVGGGGGGGGAANNGAGAGGGGGGYVEGTVVVVAGQIYGGLVGAGGGRGQASGQAATPGGTSSFTAGGATLSATGGGGGGFGNGTSVGITGAGGGGVGGDLSFAGSTGQNGIYIPTGTGNNVLFGGMGGGSRYAPTTPFPYGGGNVSGSGPGGAGSGGAGSGDGGAGFPGIVIIMA